MSDKFLTVFSFVFLSLNFICIRRVTRRRQSWEALTVLEDLTSRMWRRCTLELAFYLALISSLLVYSYSFIASGEGGNSC